MGRLDDHMKMVGKDRSDGREDSPRAAPGAQAPATGATTSEEELPAELRTLVENLEVSFRDFREMALEKLKAFKDVKGWELAGTRARCAPEMVARIYKSGRSCEVFVKEFIQQRGLAGNHLCGEMLLIAMLIDKAMVESPPEWINYKTTEIAFRRLHGIERAFSQVHQESDWRAPKGAGKTWKTKVQYALLDEIDIRKLDEGGTVIDSVEKEVRERLTAKALMQKALGKLGDGAQSEGS